MDRKKIIDGSLHAKTLRENVADEIKTRGLRPRLAIVLVGNNAASQIYVNIKMKHAVEVGVEAVLHAFDETITQNELIDFIQSLNDDTSIHGILIQMPLPQHINRSLVLRTIDPYKDVDGFAPINVGRLYTQDALFVPCTPLGIVHLIRSVQKNLSGLKASIIGRSSIVGRPVAELLLQHDCTVSIIHSKSQNIQDECIKSDILIAAVGVPNLVTREYIKDNAIVIDVGINKIAVENNKFKLVGDVNFEDVINKVKYITPVPGGVGPMTVAYLLSNTLKAAKIAHGLL